MKLIAPERLYFLALLLLPAAALCYAAWRRRVELRRLFADGGTAAAALRFSRAGRIARTALIFFALAATILAAARPYWKTQRVSFPGRGRDVAVVFDVSKSMWARDLPPSRLEHAKFLLRQLAEKLPPGDRMSLTAFAGGAYLACPLTTDRAVLNEYIGELAPDLVQRGGTDLERGLREALKSLGGNTGTQAIMVLTDGDELTGDSSKVVSELRRRKIPLIVVGLGDPDRPAVLPDENGAPRRDWRGRNITGALNEAGLKRLAAETNGAYVRSTVADTGADAILRRIGELAPADHETTEKELPEERFDLFLAAAAAALLAALVVPGRPWKKVAALALCAAIPWSADAGTPEKRPEEIPLERRMAAARSAAELYKLGTARLETEDLSGAGRCFEAVLRHPDRDERTRSKALFNLGALEHGYARGNIKKAREELREQRIDPSLRELETAKKHLDTAKELYKQALASGEADALDKPAAADLRLLEKDLAAARELKRSIEELQEQLRRAQQSAKDAQRQNQKQQQKQDKQDQQRKDQQQQNKQDRQQQQQQGKQQQTQSQDQQQNKQGKQQQNQPQDQQRKDQQQQNQPQDQQRKDQQQQNKQDRQQQQQPDQQQQNQSQDQRQERGDPAQEAARRAAEESEKLRDQAERLGQKKLEERAKLAAGELRQAEREHDPDKARPHLDRAAQAFDDLFAPPPDPPKEDGKQPPKDGAAPAPPPPEKTKPAPGGDDNEQLLRMLKDEELEQRRKMRERSRPARPILRDW